MIFLQDLVFRFGPAEYFFFALLVLVCVGLSTSVSALKSIGAILIGTAMALVGGDVVTGISRWTFGLLSLFEGLDSALVFISFVLIPSVADGSAVTATHSLIRCEAVSRAWRLALTVLAMVMFPVEWFEQDLVGHLSVAAILITLGVILRRTGVSGVSLFCAFTLGPLLEENFRRMLLLSNGWLSDVFQRPLVMGCLLVIAVVFVAHNVACRALLKRRRESRSAQSAGPIAAV
jgi:TctA family transporter